MTDALTVLLSTGAGTAAAWISKNMFLERLKNSIRAEYEEKLETHKAQLKCESDKEIERLRAQLQIASAERNVQYSRVFDQTAEIISETYSRLWVFMNAIDGLSRFRKPGEPVDRE